MGKNVFVSYKYGDDDVQHLNTMNWWEKTTVRNYVDILEREIKKVGCFYYGEHDGEDLTDLNEDQIYDHLKDKIFPTTCTIVLISPKMKEEHHYDKSQWIPWEIYYSIRMIDRKNSTSHRNGILGVVLPDFNGNYDYALRKNSCCTSCCTTCFINSMFRILRENMFNLKNAYKSKCLRSDEIWYGECSYIPLVTWAYFIKHILPCIERVEKIKDNANNYELYLSVNQIE
jgi:hypothetical protein